MTLIHCTSLWRWSSLSTRCLTTTLSLDAAMWINFITAIFEFKYLPTTNSLAYFARASLTKIRHFLTFQPGDAFEPDQQGLRLLQGLLRVGQSHRGKASQGRLAALCKNGSIWIIGFTINFSPIVFWSKTRVWQFYLFPNHRNLFVHSWKVYVGRLKLCCA
jgi:hypothetical protein